MLTSEINNRGPHINFHFLVFPTPPTGDKRCMVGAQLHTIGPNPGPHPKGPHTTAPHNTAAPCTTVHTRTRHPADPPPPAPHPYGPHTTALQSKPHTLQPHTFQPHTPQHHTPRPTATYHKAPQTEYTRALLPSFVPGAKPPTIGPGHRPSGRSTNSVRCTRAPTLSTTPNGARGPVATASRASGTDQRPLARTDGTTSPSSPPAPPPDP